MTPDQLHKHIIVRAEVLNPPLADECQIVCDWMSQLIADLGMKELAAPRARYCHDEGNEGLTADALLTTSHTCLHVWDRCNPPVMQYDLYSCSEIDPDQIIEALAMFEPTKVEWMFIDRTDGLQLVGGHK